MVTGLVKFSKQIIQYVKKYAHFPWSIIVYISHVIFLAIVRAVRSVIHKGAAFCGVTMKQHVELKR